MLARVLGVLTLVVLVCGCGRQGPAAAPRPSGGRWTGPSGELWRPFGLGDRAASFAMAQVGRPYCWGGTGPSCYDCSGLTHVSWRVAGVTIPRTSAAQHERIATVSMGALEPGDILWRPGHVGLYVGNGWAVHAPGRGKPVRYQPSHTYQAAHRPR